MTTEQTHDEYFISRSQKIRTIMTSHNVYPHKHTQKQRLSEIISKYQTLQKEEMSNDEVQSCGRIMAIRKVGRMNFFKIMDEGEFIQVVVNTAIKKSENDIDEVKNTNLEDIKNLSLDINNNGVELLPKISFTAETFAQAVDTLKRGDIVYFKGRPGKTRTGELSIFPSLLTLISPCLRTLPVEHFKIKDPELIYRKRYLDLLLNSSSRQRFITRSKIITAIRNFLVNLDFLEVETPMMNLIPGGAAAKPFITHHNELKTDFYLRISPELYLKQLVVGGLNRVFEMGKDFRNEGIDLTHNPEFTSCEFYMAYADYFDLLKMTEDLFGFILAELKLDDEVVYWPEKREERPEKVVINFARPFRKVDVIEGLNECILEKIRSDEWRNYVNNVGNDNVREEKEENVNFKVKDLDIKEVNLDENRNTVIINKKQFITTENNIVDKEKTLLSNSFYHTSEFFESFKLTSSNLEQHQDFFLYFCLFHGQNISQPHTLPRLLDKLISLLLEPTFTNPTFLINHPLCMSPLAKKHRFDPNLTERFELFINGKEICNAYTELNDPFDQKFRFEMQAKESSLGDDEAMKMDVGFVNALEFGLAPTGGWGLGVDRLVMMLTNAGNIRDVILFPAMKREDKS